MVYAPRAFRYVLKIMIDGQQKLPWAMWLSILDSNKKRTWTHMFCTIIRSGGSIASCCLPLSWIQTALGRKPSPRQGLQCVKNCILLFNMICQYITNKPRTLQGFLSNEAHSSLRSLVLFKWDWWQAMSMNLRVVAGKKLLRDTQLNNILLYGSEAKFWHYLHRQVAVLLTSEIGIQGSSPIRF